MPRSNNNNKEASQKPKRRLVYDEVDDDTAGGGAAVADVAAAAAETRPPPPQQQSTPKRRKRKQQQQQLGIEAFTSPAVASAKAAKAVTPEEEKVQVVAREDAERKALSKYVPVHVHEFVGYNREGEADLPESTRKVFRLVCDNFVVPEDFEQQRSYGPLSGTSYEERVIQEYTLGNLAPKKSGTNKTAICTSCATIGHKRFDCPSLI